MNLFEFLITSVINGSSIFAVENSIRMMKECNFIIEKTGSNRSLGSRKDNPSMADFRYNNAITNQKNSNQSLMVMLLIVA